jgi:hypothetical protein
LNRNASRRDEGEKMKKRVAIAVLVLVPLAASAQVPVRGTGGAGGIVVMGRGVVRTPVKVLRFMAQARGPADERSVLAALRSAGIDDPVIGPPGPNVWVGSNSPTAVRGTIRDVSQAKLAKIGLAAADYVRAHPATLLESIQLTPRIEDCAPIEQAARLAALGDARRRALAIAAASGVTLDAVVAVNENGGCPIESDQFNSSQQAFDLGTLSTTVTMFESVTYAIGSGEGSRRRPL